jgi:hypothetical protein
MQPAARATGVFEVQGCRPLLRAATFGLAIPGVPLRSTPGFMLSPTTAGSENYCAPKRTLYSDEVINASTIWAWIKLPLN